jgi:hypothetical protein
MIQNYPMTKCAFCRYYSGKTCMAKPDSHYCTEATNEFYAWLKTKQNKPSAQKSLRPWEKRR